MIRPTLLVLLALLAVTAYAYGTHAGWMSIGHGLDVIMWSRKLRWIFAAVAVFACLALVGLVIGGKQRTWWLIALGPVLAMFLHRYQAHRTADFRVTENPPAIEQAKADRIGPDDWVVAVTFGDVDYAFPYAELFSTPVVIQSDRDKRMILLWSAYANRALAFSVPAELKSRDLEVVAMPANAPLVYDSRTGQFVNGLTGRLVSGQKYSGFGKQMLTAKLAFADWRAAHPEGKVISTGATGPAKPLLPVYAAKGLTPPGESTDPTSRKRVVLVGTTQPTAVEANRVSRAPINLHADGEPVLLFRPQPDQPPRAFLRTFGQDIRPRFEARRDPKYPSAIFRDSDTNSWWDARGVAVGATNKAFLGKRLTPIPVDDAVDWEVLKYWHPDLQLYEEPPGSVAVEIKPPDKPADRKPTTRSTKPKKPVAR